MKFLFPFLSAGLLGLTVSGLFARRHHPYDTTLEKRRTRRMPRCECGCGCEGEECEFFDSDVL